MLPRFIPWPQTHSNETILSTFLTQFSCVSATFHCRWRNEDSIFHPWIEATVHTVRRSGWKCPQVGENCSISNGYCVLGCSWCGCHRISRKRLNKYPRIFRSIIGGNGESRWEQTFTFVQEKSSPSPSYSPDLAPSDCSRTYRNSLLDECLFWLKR